MQLSSSFQNYDRVGGTPNIMPTKQALFYIYFSINKPTILIIATGIYDSSDHVSHSKNNSPKTPPPEKLNGSSCPSVQHTVVTKKSWMRIDTILYIPSAMQNEMNAALQTQKYQQHFSAQIRSTLLPVCLDVHKGIWHMSSLCCSVRYDKKSKHILFYECWEAGKLSMLCNHLCWPFHWNSYSLCIFTFTCSLYY